MINKNDRTEKTEGENARLTLKTGWVISVSWETEIEELQACNSKIVR